MDKEKLRNGLITLLGWGVSGCILTLFFLALLIFWEFRPSLAFPKDSPSPSAMEIKKLPYMDQSKK